MAPFRNPESKNKSWDDGGVVGDKTGFGVALQPL
jgi:hypothetical protein